MSWAIGESIAQPYNVRSVERLARKTTRQPETGVQPGNSFCHDFPPSPTFLLGHNHSRIMQNLDRPAFCQPCQKPTNHQIRYRSDPDFVGRVLTCENCGQRKLEPLGPGTCCQDCWQEYKTCG